MGKVSHDVEGAAEQMHRLFSVHRVCAAWEPAKIESAHVGWLSLLGEFHSLCRCVGLLSIQSRQGNKCLSPLVVVSRV